MRLSSRLLSVLSVLLAVSCAVKGGEEVVPGGETTLPGLSSLTVSGAGGRNRAEIRWSGCPKEITSLAVTFDAAKGAVVLPTGGLEEGSSMVSDLTEQSASFPVSAIAADGTAYEISPVRISVYGERYENSLPEGSASCIFRGAVASLELSPVNHYCFNGYRIKYTSVSSEEKTLFTSKDQSTSVTLTDVGSDISVSPAFKPEETMEDLFFGPEILLKQTDTPVELPLNETVDGYRGIWFDLGQAASSYGSKYSGGLGTYTVKHIPMAIYAPAVNRTYFVYGGTPAADRKYLLCMVGCYDHNTGMLQKPRIVMDKGVLGVADPHDDPTIQIDRDGFIWVFVAGRGNKRNGVRYRSRLPYDITSFEYINEDIMAYPQVMYNPDKGFFLFFTRYDGTRQLFYKTSEDGVTWTPHRQLASIKEGTEKNSGHYQVSNICGTKLCTAFNRHINGNVDTRTNIYYVQSTDWGQTWTTADGTPVTVPVTERYSNCLLKDYQSTTETHNCYIKDLNFDSAGNPIILYLTSRNHLTGPDGGTRQWHTLHWTGSEWEEGLITTSTHCYDSGALWVEGKDWVVIAPTDPGPQYWGTGGEVVRWRSSDEGKTWVREMSLTSGSVNNHSYMRRPYQAADGFYSFWADGNPDSFTQSYLYFCTKSGVVYRMPYNMDSEWALPERL